MSRFSMRLSLVFEKTKHESLLQDWKIGIETSVYETGYIVYNMFPTRKGQTTGWTYPPRF